ncbi:vancomycin high temperature exclusion protein [Tenacibaculum sp. 190524A02b]|uniref:SanA/YdcF family protein n=1 Tax=Tenacibaculum vairaonense TaxID=3137860 RepID=UPI0032B1A97F
MQKNAKEKVFSDTNRIPKNKVGLVLGTSKYLIDGRINLYYKYRVEAAASLFKSGKIEFILVSGDNGTKSYDEPTSFKEDLISKGVPEDKIFLDYAGFRTLDSVVRASKVFGQESITIISQRFHNERALYLAKHFTINAVGFNARDVSGRYGLKVQLREYLARVKLFVDILVGVQPKFLGKKINIV